MYRLVLLLALAAAVAGPSSSSDQQRRAFEEYQRILQAQRQFGDISGFSDPSLCRACGGGYVQKLSPRSAPRS